MRRALSLSAPVENPQWQNRLCAAAQSDGFRCAQPIGGSSGKLVEQRQHHGGIRHRQHGVDALYQARLEQCVARLADRAERSTKAMILPGDLEQALVGQRIDEVVGVADEADQRMRRERGRVG